MKYVFSYFKKNKLVIAAVVICIIFFIVYATLSVIRHNHYQSGFDLGINDQTVWRYSTFQAPITTSAPFPDKPKLSQHVELVYALISPFYWIWSSRQMLLILEAAFLCVGGLAIFLLAKERKLSPSVSFSLLIGYLAFFGIQNAVWFDVHSASFGTAFLAWFIYFLEKKNHLWTIILFLLTVTSKEHFAFLTLAIAFVYFIKRKEKITLLLIMLSFIYLLFIFFIFFPHIMNVAYLYQNKGGLLSNINPLSFFDTTEKQLTTFYTFLSVGFLPLLAPLYVLPALADLAIYFVIGSDLPGAQGIFMHYRVALAPLLAWAVIMTIHNRKFLNNKYIAIYLLLITIGLQYFLHLPLSYLTKSWFWEQPPSVKNINLIKNSYLPKDASVVAQVNIIPHLTHRDKIYTLYPEKKHFSKASPCGKPECNWFRWYGTPEFLFVDTSSEWDIRHLLANREEFIDGIHNLEKAAIITPYKQEGNTVLYKINQNPVIYK